MDVTNNKNNYAVDYPVDDLFILIQKYYAKRKKESYPKERKKESYPKERKKESHP